MGLKQTFRKAFGLSYAEGAVKGTEAGAVDNSISGAKKNRYLQYEEKAVYRTRKDIADFNEALSMALAQYPINYPLQLMYDEICIDALLTSQIENRENQLLGRIFNLKNADGTNNDEQTKILKAHPLYRFFVKTSFGKKLRGNRVVELKMKTDLNGKPVLSADTIPGTNIVQQTGLFYPDYYDTSKYIKYRELPEFGTWVLEFDNGDLGMLHKAIPHVLFKRFAQSCWSELCEIYGTPPRVLKTNTQDKTMLQRATKMMKDLGNSSWYIIDNNEAFDWATGTNTNGDVYKALMDACRDELCLLFSGAIIGQDTKNGSRSKDKIGQEMLFMLGLSDMQATEEDFNNIIIPALVKHGVIKDGLTFAYEPSEDIQQLWDRTVGALQFYNVDPEWVKTKFGIEITGERPQPIKGASGNPDSSSNLKYKGSKGFFETAPQD